MAGDPRTCDQKRPPAAEPGRPASRSIVTVTSWSRNLEGAGGSRWKRERMAPGILTCEIRARYTGSRMHARVDGPEDTCEIHGESDACTPSKGPRVAAGGLRRILTSSPGLTAFACT
jgi:hypothetical protein